MKYFIYHTEDGYINRFLTTGVSAVARQFKPVTLKGEVNEWLKSGFAIYENPCRKEFLEGRKGHLPEYVDLSGCFAGQEVEISGQKRLLSIYFPFGNQGVDFSDFYYTPHYLRSYSYTELFADQEETVSLSLETCGGVTVWVNEELITDFIPFTRNMSKKTIITVTLKKGINKLAVCLDDLAERDTDYYFRLRYLGKGHVKICIPAKEETEVEEMERIESMLSDISFDREVYLSEPVELQIENPLSYRLDVQVAYRPVADKIAHSEVLTTKRCYELEAGEKALCLFQADDVIPGYYYFDIAAGVTGIWASRKIGVQIFSKKLLVQKESQIKDRKREALCYLRDVEVDNVYKAAAILSVGGDREEAERILLEELEGIRARKDCSDFHLVVVMQIEKMFGSKLTEEVQIAIRKVILEFRYWITEPGDDVMWFFSENHSLLFHICQYYAGKTYPEAVFTNSGLTGREQKEKAEALLEHWFSVFFRELITEWNSNAYIPVDVLGLCGLYNLEEEGSHFRDLAGKALDCLFRDLAVNEHKGMVMTTFGRSYEKESKGNYAAGTSSLLYIAYNTGCLNRAALAYISFALGDYVPCPENQKYLGLTGEEKLVYEKTQGYEQHVDLYLYKDSRTQLSTAIHFHPFTPGYQEHIMQAVIDPVAQAYVNHPGEIQPYGNGRPNYWAGNGSLPAAYQYKNLGVMIYHIPPEHPVGFTHAYVPLMEFDAYLGSDCTVAAEKDGGYIGIRAENGIRMQTAGPCKYREFISEGRDNIWLVVTGRKEEFYTLAEFHQALMQAEIEDVGNGNVTVNHTCVGQLKIAQGLCLVDGKSPYIYPGDCKGQIQWLNE